MRNPVSPMAIVGIVTALVIIGGLISSTLLTMLLLPTLYELFDRWFGRNRTKQPAEES